MEDVKLKKLNSMKHLVSILILIFLSSCIRIKDKFPEIDYYTLRDMPTETGVGAKVKGSLLVRDVTLSQAYDTQYMYDNLPDGSIEKYHYHQWIGLPSTLISDFFYNRFNSYEAFSGGVIKDDSKLTPDYILELSVTKFDAVKAKNGGKVNVSITALLFKRESDRPNKTVIFNESYSLEINREDATAKSISKAFSKILSILSDKILVEIQEQVS